MPDAHAIDITKCNECPYGPDSATMPEAKTTQCKHPLRLIGENLEVTIDAPPPATCPHREKLTVLRVIVPFPVRRPRQRRNVQELH